MTVKKEAPPPFENPQRLAYVVQILLAIQILISLFNIHLLFAASFYPVIFKTAVSPVVAETIESTALFANTLESVIYIITGILFIMWLKMLRRNLDSFEVAELESESWHCSWGFIVPIVNLWKPFVLVREIWKASSPKSKAPTDWKLVKASALISWWWFFFVTFFISSRVTRFLEKGFGNNTSDNAYWQMLISTITTETVRFVAAFLAIALVRKLTDRQMQKQASVAVQESRE